MSADHINYEDLLIITSVQDGKIDFPYGIYSFVCAYDNRVFYSIDQVEGLTVLANVHVKKSEYDEAKLLPQVVSDYENDPRVDAFWDKTNADVLAENSDDPDNPDNPPSMMGKSMNSQESQNNELDKRAPFYILN